MGSLPEGEWAVTESQRGVTQIEVNELQRPEKWASSWEEGLSSLLEGEWAGAES